MSKMISMSTLSHFTRQTFVKTRISASIASGCCNLCLPSTSNTHIRADTVSKRGTACTQKHGEKYTKRTEVGVEVHKPWRTGRVSLAEYCTGRKPNKTGAAIVICMGEEESRKTFLLMLRSTLLLYVGLAGVVLVTSCVVAPVGGPVTNTTDNDRRRRRRRR